jgi:hypothetical protein
MRAAQALGALNEVPPAAPPAPLPNALERGRLQRILTFAGPMDAYCIVCGTERVFNVIWSGNEAYFRGPFTTVYFTKRFRCAWNEEHHIQVSFRTGPQPWTITKVGQYPSVADLVTEERQTRR